MNRLAARYRIHPTPLPDSRYLPGAIRTTTVSIPTLLTATHEYVLAFDTDWPVDIDGIRPSREVCRATDWAMST